MHAHVSREEWVFRGLAIAMCLAMVGMAVMPLINGNDVGYTLVYLVTNGNKDKAVDGGIAFGAALGTVTGAAAAAYYAKMGATLGAIIGGGIAGFIVGGVIGFA